MIAAALLAGLLISPWGAAEVSAAPVAENPAATPAGGPWAGLEALWQRITSWQGFKASNSGAIVGGGTGGEVGQGLDPDGGGGDPGEDEEEPSPPPPDDGTTSGGGDGGAL